MLLKVRNHIPIIPINKKVQLGGTTNSSVTIEDEDGLVYKLLQLCDGKNDEKDIFDKLQEDYPYIELNGVKSILNQLSKLPYLFELNMNPIQDERQSRNLNFLSNFDIYGNEKEDFLKRIVNSNIMIIGLGGAGTNFLYNMMSWGVKKIVGIDFDKVEISNLNRQIFFEEKHVGEYKVDVIKKNINKFNSSINFIPINKKITNKEEIKQLINQNEIDYVLCSADSPQFWILKWCNEACIDTHTTWSYTGMSEYITRFQTIIPGETSCYECWEREINTDEESKEKYDILLNNEHRAENDCILANSSLAASLLSFDVIKILGELPKTNIMSINNKVNFDHFTNELYYESINKSDYCYCSNYT